MGQLEFQETVTGNAGALARIEREARTRFLSNVCLATVGGRPRPRSQPPVVLFNQKSQTDYP